MNRFIYPDEMLPVVMELKENHTNKELAEMISEMFGFDMTEKKMHSYLSNRKIKRNKRKRIEYPERSKFTLEQQAFMKENYKGIGPKQMAEILNKKYGTSYTRQDVKSFYHNKKLDSGLTGRFEKGCIPWSKGMKGKMPPTKYNAGRFKKGNIPLDYKAVGTVAKRADGYWIKIDEPDIWEQYHRVIYKQVYGEIPENTNVGFKDGDKFNIKPENLMLLTKKEHIQMTTRKFRSSNAEFTEAGLNLIKLENIIKEKRKAK